MWSDEPRAYSDLPPQLFAMFYLTDTSPRNGCLRVIPGSHRKRHRLLRPPRQACFADAQNAASSLEPL